MDLTHKASNSFLQKLINLQSDETMQVIVMLSGRSKEYGHQNSEYSRRLTQKVDEEQQQAFAQIRKIVESTNGILLSSELDAHGMLKAQINRDAILELLDSESVNRIQEITTESS